MHVLEIGNAELMESITKQAAERGTTHTDIVALIGAIDSFTVSTNPLGTHRIHLFQLPLASRDDRHRRDHRRQTPHPRRLGGDPRGPKPRCFRLFKQVEQEAETSSA
jgi:hypothetical protein